MNRFLPKFWREPGLYFTGLLFVWIVVMMAVSLSFPYRAKLFPLVVGFIGLLLILLILLGSILTSGSRLVGSSDKVEQGISDKDTEIEKKLQVAQAKEASISYRALLRIALWYCGGTLAFILGGYVLGSAIFLFLFLMFYGRYRLRMSIGITVLIVLPLWFIFSCFLEIPALPGFFS